MEPGPTTGRLCTKCSHLIGWYLDGGGSNYSSCTPRLFGSTKYPIEYVRAEVYGVRDTHYGTNESSS
jgi:hypothetical protein